MRAMKSVQTVFVTALLLCLAPPRNAATPEQGQSQDPEVQLGKQTFDELKVRVEIIESSPLYDQLKPIADAITKAAQPRYNHPFKFYLVHEAQPNAFATPGGNVYVVDSLLYFVRNADELAVEHEPRRLYVGSGVTHDNGLTRGARISCRGKWNSSMAIPGEARDSPAPGLRLRMQ